MKYLKTYNESINTRDVSLEWDRNHVSDFIDPDYLNDVLLDFLEEYDLVYKLDCDYNMIPGLAFDILLKQPNQSKVVKIEDHLSKKIGHALNFDWDMLKEIDDRLAEFNLTIKKGGTYTIGYMTYHLSLGVYERNEKYIPLYKMNKLVSKLNQKE